MDNQLLNINPTEYHLLQFFSFAAIDNWSAYAILGNNIGFKSDFPFAKIKEFLIRNKTQVEIEDNVLYKRPKIKLYNNGILLRDEVLGKEIGTKNQFRISKGQFLLSKIDARNGAFGVIADNLHNGVITGNFWTFDVDYNKIDPYYLNLVTSSKAFHNFCQSASVGTTGRNYLQEDAFLNISIPLPTKEQQKKIVDDFNNKIDAAKKLDDDANKIENSIDEILMHDLEVIRKIAAHKKGLVFINFKDIERWGVEFLVGTNDNPNAILNSKKYKNVRLTELTEINPRVLFNDIKKSEATFIPMECVSDDYGEIQNPKIGDVKLSKGYTRFLEGDLLWAKITPCMENGKSAIAYNLINGIGYGSTEFHTFRLKTPRELSIRYLHYILRTKIVRDAAVSHFTGSSGQQRVPKLFFEEMKIPVPPMDIQEKIVSKLDELKVSVKKKRDDAQTFIEQSKTELEQILFKK